ncbi:MAG: ERCC4 domain-containing protein [bacterium]
MSDIVWILERTGEAKFPYRLSIKKGEDVLLQLRVQDKWPGARGHIFCMREELRQWPDVIEEIERVPVVSLNRYGKRLAVVLDRATNKRCDFLFLTKRYKTQEGEYEQIFWRTQQGLKQRRPKVILTANGNPSLHIIIDINEKYPWNFHGCTVERQSLPAGDYALIDGGRIVSVVERKSFENMLHDFMQMHTIHQKIGEIEAYKHSAIVIEANYSDFLNPKKQTYYPVAFLAKAIAEIYAMHPRVNIVFAGNRKLANEWVLRYFSSIQSHEQDVPHFKVAEVMAEYGQPKEINGGIYFDIKKRIIDETPQEFNIAMIKELFPDVALSTIKRVLMNLRKQGALACNGRGKNSKWIWVTRPNEGMHQA